MNLVNQLRNWKRHVRTVLQHFCILRYNFERNLQSALPKECDLLTFKKQMMKFVKQFSFSVINFLNRIKVSCIFKLHREIPACGEISVKKKNNESFFQTALKPPSSREVKFAQPLPRTRQSIVQLALEHRLSRAAAWTRFNCQCFNFFCCLMKGKIE